MNINPTIILQIGLCAVGLIIGHRLPDIDLAPVLPLRHRSAWTHGPLFVFLIWKAATLWPDYRLFFVGLLIALGGHLLEDAGPKSWRGSAMINFFPIPFSLPSVFSMLYLAASAFGAVWAFIGLI